jgi:hypothetical protein
MARRMQHDRRSRDPEEDASEGSTAGNHGWIMQLRRPGRSIWDGDARTRAEGLLYPTFTIVASAGLAAWLFVGDSPPLLGPALLGRAAGPRHGLIDLHFVAGLVTLPLVAHHVAHHWRWMLRAFPSLARQPCRPSALHVQARSALLPSIEGGKAMRTSRVALVVGLALAVVHVPTACGSSGPAAEPPRGGGGGEPPHARSREEALAPPQLPPCDGVVEHVEDDRQVVEACHEPTARVGQETRVSFAAVGKPPWHISPGRSAEDRPDTNPARLRVITAEGFAVATPELLAGAALQLDERVLRFELALVPETAGNLPVEFGLRVPLENPEQGMCSSPTVPLRWAVAVSAD